MRAPYTIRGNGITAYRIPLLGWLLYADNLTGPLTVAGKMGEGRPLEEYLTGRTAEEAVALGRKFADGPKLTYQEVCAKSIDGWC